MATIVLHTKDLPEYDGPLIPGLKGPFKGPIVRDDGDPAEVDAFLALLREINGKPPINAK